jgi:hypothetical protein
MPERQWVPTCERCGEPIRLGQPLAWLYELSSGMTHPYHPECARLQEEDQMIRRLEATVERLRSLGAVVSYTIERF